MRIALALEYPMALRGGVSVLVEVLALGLARRGHEIVLISDDTPERFAASAVAGSVSRHIEWSPLAVSPAKSRTLAEQIAAENVDIAHFHLGGPFGWGNRFPGHCVIPYLGRKSVPIISTAHLVISFLEGYCGPQRPWLYKAAMLPLAWTGKAQQLQHVKREIAVSKYDCGKLQQWYWPFRGRYMQIYHSRLPAAPAITDTLQRESVVLNVGHVAWRKGQALLAEAFAQIAPRFPEWKLILAGHDSGDGAAARVREVAKNAGLESRILLAGQREDTEDLMRRAGIYVQPSYFEGLPLALQEAMFHGCPCIGTRVNGIPELIQHESTGYLIEPGNAAPLSQALEALMTAPERRAKFGQASREFIAQSKMSAEAMVEEHLHVYEMALRESGSAR